MLDRDKAHIFFMGNWYTKDEFEDLDKNNP